MLITKTTLFTRFDASIFNVTKVYLHICILVKLIWILFSTTSKLILPTFRYSDFIVNEIDEEGKLVKLTNLDVDPTLIQAVCMSVSIHKVTGSRLCHDLSICMAIQKYYKYFELYDFRFIVMKIIQYCYLVWVVSIFWLQCKKIWLYVFTVWMTHRKMTLRLDIVDWYMWHCVCWYIYFIWVTLHFKLSLQKRIYYR